MPAAAADHHENKIGCYVAMKRMTFKQTNFSNKVNIRCIHTAFHDSLFILCCFLYHIKVTSLRDSNSLQWTETETVWHRRRIELLPFLGGGLFTTLFLLLHSLLRNRKTLRTLESGHFNLRTDPITWRMCTRTPFYCELWSSKHSGLCFVI